MAAKGDKKDGANLRLFAGLQNYKLVEVNEYLIDNGVKPLESAPYVGLEITKPLFLNVSLGARLAWKYGVAKEKADPPAIPLNPYYASIQQQQAMFTLRMALINSSSVHLDIFGGAGVTDTKLEIRTAAGQGRYERSDDARGYVSMAGATLGVGWAGYLLFVEAGQEWSELEGLKRSGYTSPSIAKLDLTGTFINAGILFRELPSFFKSKGGK